MVDPTFLDIVCHTGYRRIPDYHNKFIYPVLDKVIDVHKTTKSRAQWDYIAGCIRLFLEDSEQIDAFRETAFLLYALANEKSLRESVYQELLAERKKDTESRRYRFFAAEWEPYLLEQTITLQTYFTQDISKALILYSDSLCESWIHQSIQKIGSDTTISNDNSTSTSNTSSKKRNKSTNQSKPPQKRRRTNAKQKE